MFAKIVIDNNTPCEELCAEWGFSAYIEVGGVKILLDTGASSAFVKNIDVLGIKLSEVDFGVLSHAHYDHSDGMDAFFEQNSKAKFYLREGSAEDCYRKGSHSEKYIGIKEGILDKYADRIEYVSGDFELCKDAWLIPHKTPGLGNIGAHAHMYRKINGEWVPDDFAHEQSLVIRSEKGLVVFNSCSHGGAGNIIREVGDSFPGEKIYALVGGLHLFESTEAEVLEVAEIIKSLDIQKVVTGHCTGEESFAILKAQLGDKLDAFYSGYVLE